MLVFLDWWQYISDLIFSCMKREVHSLLGIIFSGEQSKAWNKHMELCWKTFPGCFTWTTKKSNGRSTRDKQSNKWCYSQVRQASEKRIKFPSYVVEFWDGFKFGGISNGTTPLAASVLVAT